MKSWLVINNKQRVGVVLRSDDTRSFCIAKYKSKHGELTFSNFFSRLLNKLNFDNFDNSFEKFQNDRLKNGIIY